MWSKPLKTALTWFLAFLIFYFLFKKYPLHQLILAAAHLNAPYFVLYASVYFFFMWSVDCWSLAWIVSRFASPISLWEIMEIRFASYLVMILNYGAAQGMLAYLFKRTKGIPIFKGTGLVVLTMIIDLYWTFFIAFIGSFFTNLTIQGVNMTSLIRLIFIASTAGLCVLMALRRLPLRWKIVNWVRSRKIVDTLQCMNLKDLGIAMSLRLPLHLAINTSFYFIAMTYGVRLPLLTVLSRLPIIILIGTIPITPGGLGTIQFATIEFFKHSIHGDILNQGLISASELLLSMSLMFVFANYFLKTLAGMFFFQRVLRRDRERYGMTND